MNGLGNQSVIEPNVSPGESVHEMIHVKRLYQTN
jgi:hypothetical protein